MFRSQRADLRVVLQKCGCRDYLRWLERWEDLVRRQDRGILDHELPDEVVLAAMARLEMEFYVDEFQQLRLLTEYRQPAGGTKVLGAVEVASRYGGAIIEEVLEKGSALPEVHPFHR